jgi:hypothetical protein
VYFIILYVIALKGKWMLWQKAFNLCLLGHDLLTYLLTYSWSWALLEELPTLQLLKNFPIFYGTQRFLTVFTTALHWSLSWATSIQSLPPTPVSLSYILILSTHQCLGLSSGLFPSGFPTNIPRLPHSCYMLWPSHPPWHDQPNYTWRRVQVMKLLIMQFFLRSSIFPSLLVQIFSSAPCSHTSLVYVPPLTPETELDTHTKLQAKLY